MSTHQAVSLCKAHNHLWGEGWDAILDSIRTCPDCRIVNKLDPTEPEFSDGD